MPAGKPCYLLQSTTLGMDNQSGMTLPKLLIRDGPCHSLTRGTNFLLTLWKLSFPAQSIAMREVQSEDDQVKGTVL
jgi:hypothetical protein